MKLNLNKSQSSVIPAQVLSAIKKYQTEVEGSIKNNIDKLTDWFI